MPVGPHILWPLAAKKSTSSAHVDGHVRGRLRAVDQDDGARGVRARHDRFERRDRADGVADVRQGDEARPVQQVVQAVEDVAAFGVHLDEAQLGAGLGREQLPRDEVGVVLQLRRDDGVSGAQVREAPQERHEVDRLGRVARPDDLRRLRGVDESRDLRARAFEGVGGPLGEFVDAAMDVRIVGRVIVDERVDDGLGLLRRRRQSR